jgi:hypothetical protein
MPPPTTAMTRTKMATVTRTGFRTSDDLFGVSGSVAGLAS